MMNSRKSSGVQLIRYVFLLPVLLVLTTAFTLFKTELKANLGFQDTLKTSTKLPASLQAEKPAVTLKKSAVKRKEKNASSNVVSEPQRISHAVEIERPVYTKEADTGKGFRTIQVSRINIGESNADGAPEGTRTFMFKSRGVGSMFLTSKDSVKVLILKGNKNDGKPFQGSFPGQDSDVKIYIDDVEVSAEKMKELNPSDIESVDVQKIDQYPKTKGVRIYTKVFKKLK